MKLVIVESPNKCKTIEKYLGSDYKVVASNGNIRDLSTHGKGGLGIDVENGFKPDWIVDTKKKATVSMLKKEVKEAEEVFLASDPDREGEAISYHLASVLSLPVETTKRLRFNEITKPVIEEVIANPSTIDMNLVNAQITRRMEDRIIGFKLSGILKRGINLKSAGRVQSATLKLIVDRNKVIESFVPKEYWNISVEINLKGKKYKIPLSKVDGKSVDINTEEEAKAIIDRIPDVLEVKSVESSVKEVSPKLPLTTSTMQQEAFNRFKFSNQKTQSIAQKLFEGVVINGERIGIITYLRTDSTRISPEFFRKHAVPFFKETLGDKYIGSVKAPSKKSSANIQDGHEAIRPTGTHRTPEYVAQFVEPDEAKLYRLIYCRAMASLMADKVEERKTVILSGNGIEFALKGSKTIFDGFMALYGKIEKDDDTELPEIQVGDTAKLVNKLPEQKFTKPEPRYNEASIVKAMEEYGIGRPSTYATTITTLLKRKYISKSKGSLIPTEDGITAINYLERYFPDEVSTSYTAKMEETLDKIEGGEESSDKAMIEFYNKFTQNFEDVSALFAKLGGVPTEEKCPECGHDLIYRLSKNGKTFIGCSNYPNCHYVFKETKEVEEVGEICPECGKPLIYKYNGKGEKFIGCSGFPSCKYTRSMNASANDVSLNKSTYTEEDYVKPCPKCGNGHLVIKHGKRTDFLGCTNFPKCRYHEWLTEKKK